MPPTAMPDRMEACVGAHHLSRKLRAMGDDARLMRSMFAPIRRGRKEIVPRCGGNREAVQRPTMKFVATKTADQLDLQALHRVRERLVSRVRHYRSDPHAFLLERGIAAAAGTAVLRAELSRLATPPSVLSPRMRAHYRRSGRRLAPARRAGRGFIGEDRAIARQDAGCERLMSVPWIGRPSPARIVAADRRRQVFTKGRDFAASLGARSPVIEPATAPFSADLIQRAAIATCGLLFVQAASVVLIKPKGLLERHGLSPGVRGGQEARTSRHGYVSAIASPTSSPASLERPAPWPGVRGPEDGSGSDQSA